MHHMLKQHREGNGVIRFGSVGGALTKLGETIRNSEKNLKPGCEATPNKFQINRTSKTLFVYAERQLFVATESSKPIFPANQRLF